MILRSNKEYQGGNYQGDSPDSFNSELLQSNYSQEYQYFNNDFNDNYYNTGTYSDVSSMEDFNNQSEDYNSINFHNDYQMNEKYSPYSYNNVTSPFAKLMNLVYNIHPNKNNQFHKGFFASFPNNIKEFFYYNNTRLVLVILFLTVICSVIWGVTSHNNQREESEIASTDTSVSDNLSDNSSQSNNKTIARATVPTQQPTTTPKNELSISDEDINDTEESTIPDNETPTVLSSSESDNTNNTADDTSIQQTKEDVQEQATQVQPSTPQPETTLVPESVNTFSSETLQATESISTSIIENSSWKSGDIYSCIYKFTIHNNSSDYISNWSALITLSSDTGCTSIWNATATEDNGTLHILPADWNKNIYQNSEISFEICLYSRNQITTGDLTFTVNY